MKLVANTGKNRYVWHGYSRVQCVLLSSFVLFSPYFMPTGSIKTKTDKGFGFIKMEGSPDVFFHHSACGGQFDNLQVGQEVQFEVEQGPKGPKATNVQTA